MTWAWSGCRPARPARRASRPGLLNGSPRRRPVPGDRGHPRGATGACAWCWRPAGDRPPVLPCCCSVPWSSVPCAARSALPRVPTALPGLPCPGPCRGPCPGPAGIGLVTCREARGEMPCDRGFACYVCDPATTVGAAGVVRVRPAPGSGAQRRDGVPLPPRAVRAPGWVSHPGRRPVASREPPARAVGPGRPGRWPRSAPGPGPAQSTARPGSGMDGAGRSLASPPGASHRGQPPGPAAGRPAAGASPPGAGPPGAACRRPELPVPQRGGCGRLPIGYEQQCISRPVVDDPMFIGGYTDQGRRRGDRGAGWKTSRTAGKGCALLSDLAAVTPPAVVCVAFLIGVGLFLRHQLGPKRESAEDEYPEDISGDGGIPHSDGSQSDASQSAASPDRGER